MTPIKKAYYDVYRLVGHIYEPHKSACRRILKENRAVLAEAPGSLHNHQNWPGGYLHHVQEVMNIARVLYEGLNEQRPLAFSLSDALLVLFLHDIEKPWRFTIEPDGKTIYEDAKLGTEAEKRMFREEMVGSYGIVLTPEQENALRYVEGEKMDYSPDRRVMNPLAAFCHLCDVTSARIWPDYPKRDGTDPWPGVDLA